jgi:hypothetical protein
MIEFSICTCNNEGKSTIDNKIDGKKGSFDLVFHNNKSKFILKNVESIINQLQSQLKFLNPACKDYKIKKKEREIINKNFLKARKSANAVDRNISNMNKEFSSLIETIDNFLNNNTENSN